MTGQTVTFQAPLRPDMADLVRLIPNCFVTGHAAGVAAAVAAVTGCTPRDVDVAKVQQVLREQKAYLGE